MSNPSRAPSPTTETANGASAPTATRRASPSRSTSSGAGTAEKSAMGSTMDDSALLKEDSEAETIIQSGREELSPEKKRKKVIKHERDPSEERKILESAEHEEPPSSDVKVRKRKRVDEPGQDAYPSSPRSSLLSSPGPLPSSDRAGSETASTRHRSPSTERRKLKGEGRSKRRLSDGEWHDREEHTRRVRRHVSPSRHEGRDIRSATYARQSSGDRSPSPRSRTHQRVFSAQSSLPSFKKKRIPPPLTTSKKRHLSEDRQSRSSSNSDSPAPTSHARRFVSGDSSANSPAKSMVPMPRKIKDQSGRTWLARACASGDLEAVKQRLEERPEDLNVSDHAGNTPLQISALEGHARIVRFLLQQGSDPNTKNCDEDTPLIDAVENDHIKVVKTLLEHGANPRQPNSQGEEPYELAKEDSETRSLLSDAMKKTDMRRRKSNAGSTQLYSAASPRDSPPVDGPRVANARRKAHRAETRNDLLWVSATPEKLREFAAKGDTQAVGHLLQIVPAADTASVIAAAKGGHEEVLGLLLGMGNPKPDPGPLRNGPYREGFNTPMLAAIGRGNNKVIKLLLEQTDFNPTRTVNNKTYYEISKERKGDDWEKEYELLKDAYDNHSSSKKKIRKKESQSPRQSRDKEKTTKTSSRLKSESPASVNRKQHPTATARKSESRSKGSDLKRETSSSIKEKPISGATETIKRSRLADGNTSDHSVAVTDQEAEPLGPPKVKSSVARRKSDVSLRNADSADKRGRLLSGKAKKEQDKTRRASIMSSDSVSSKEDALKGRPDLLHLKDKSALKRARQSPSPERSRSRDPDHKKVDDTQKKRRRVDTDDTNPPKLDRERSKSHATTESTRGVARKVSKPAAVEQPPPPEKKRSQVGSVFENYRKSQQAAEKSDKTEKADKNEKSDKVDKPEKTDKLEKTEKPEKPDPATTKPTSSHSEDVEMEEPKKTVSKTSETEAKEAAKAQAAREKAQAAQREKAEAEERAAEEKRQAEVEKARIAAEKAAAEKAAEEAKKKAAQEAKEKAELELKEAALLREKELAAAKKRQEEELEQKRKAELEEAETRRRIKLEEEQRLLEEKRLEEEKEAAEVKRQDALPNTLRVSAHLIHTGNPEAKARDFIKRFNSLVFAKTAQLVPGAPSKIAEDRWIPNFQAVLLLATTDLKLRLIPDLEKLPATKLQKFRMWACCNKPLSQPYPPNPLDGMDPIMDQAEEAMHKFYAMADDEIFWIKLDNFLAVIPEYPHLAGLKIKQTEMHIDQEDGKDDEGVEASVKEDESADAPGDEEDTHASATMEASFNTAYVNGNGNGEHATNGFAVTNGYHDEEH